MPNSIEEGAKKEQVMFLFKGEPSSGKSIAAASFPNCYIFDMEDRIRSVAAHWLPKGKRDIQYDTYGYADYNRFDAMWDKFEDASKMNKFPYDTIIVDTLTSCSDLLLHHVNREKGLAGKKLKKVGGVTVNSIEDYNAESSALTELVLFMRQIKCKYKILVAHVVKTDRQDLENNETVVTRALLTAGKKVAAKLPGYFDEIYHFEQKPQAGRPRFMVQTMSTGEDFARTTLALPQVIDQTGQSLFDIIKPKLQEVIQLGNVNPIVPPILAK